jgi:DNA repair protein RecN (Recombination protein N)
MLQELCIENLALIERAQIPFGPGLNVITGETGAGKSLLIDALELLLGERPKASLVRKGAPEARVEGRFVVPREAVEEERVLRWMRASVPALLEELEQQAGEEREILLTRTLHVEGRSKAWVNHRPATARVLRELAGFLVEVHGQNEHQKLLETDEQARLLDGFGNLELKLAGYREARAVWLRACEQLSEFEQRSRTRAEREDLLRFQAGELTKARLSPGEFEDLQGERELLRNSAAVARAFGGLAEELSEGEGNALGRIVRAERVLENWEERLPAARAALAQLREARAHLEEASVAIARLCEGGEGSPERLDAIEERLVELENLQRKYRCDVAGLLARTAELERELRAIETAGEDFAALRESVKALREAVRLKAEDLGKARRSLCTRLEKAVRASLAELGLERARFEVRIEKRARPDLQSPNLPEEKTRELEDVRLFGPDGADAIEFLLAANPGEDAQPLAKVASGGEAARIMLALRTALALRMSIPTLIFDEVDSGVGGRLGPRLGEHLRALGARHQVLCVTHMPAIAAVAHRHFKVEKDVVANRTRTRVSPLEGEARVEEIADMIAGGSAHASARAEAQRLLGG